MKFLILCLIFAVFSIAVDVLGGVPGGANQLTDTDKLKYLRDKIKNHLVTLSGKPDHPHLEYVGHSSATYQVVAGMLYKVNATFKENEQETECFITLWEKPWLNFEKFTANCGEEPKHTYESVVGEERRRKRAAVLGGPQEVPQEEWPELHTKMQNAFTQLGAKHANFGYNYKNIVEATKQVVAGISYKVIVVVESVEESNDTTKECEVSIWEKAWENFQKVTLKCDKAKYEYTSTTATLTPSSTAQ